MVRAHAKQLAGLRLLGDLVEPVAVREAQEVLEVATHRALETLDRAGVVDRQLVERHHHAVGKHQQRRLLEMRDQEQQELLMPELRQHAAFEVDEERRLRAAHHHQRRAAAHVAGVRRHAGAAPEAVVAVARLEIGQVFAGIRQTRGQARRQADSRRRFGADGLHVGRRHDTLAGHQPQAHEVGAAQLARVVERQVGGHRHAVELDLAVAQRAGQIGLIGHQRFEQPAPVRRQPRRAVRGDVGQEGIALVRVGARQHLALVADPHRVGRAMQAAALGVPAGRITAAEAVQHLLRHRQRQVAGADLDVERDDVDVVEEIQVDVLDLQLDRLGRFGQLQAHTRHVVAAQHVHRRGPAGAPAGAPLGALAVQKALHIRQEGDELVVVALVEVFGVAGVLVDHLAPRAAGHGVQQVLPGPQRVGHALAGHELQGPEQALAKLADEGHAAD